MRDAEEVAREVLGCHVEIVEPGRTAAGTRYCGEHRYPWLHDVDMCPKQERLAKAIRARDAEARVETLAGFTEWFAPAYTAPNGNTCPIGPETVAREFAESDARDMASPEDETPVYAARRLVGPWEPEP